MSDITLTESEAQMLARCLSEHSEPPADLAAKLFPTVHAKFDFRTLNNARIPTIEYAGKAGIKGNYTALVSEYVVSG